MTDLLVCSWAARGGGRAKALLAIVRRCVDAGLDVDVVTGTRSWGPDRLEHHHGIAPAGTWTTTDWREKGPSQAVTAAIDATDPDVILAFDTVLVSACRERDRPVIGYCRTSAVPGVEEHWAPSRAAADDHTAALAPHDDGPCRPIYPIWYIEPIEDAPPPADRPIDVMIHGRKARDAVDAVNPEYNVVLANRFTAPELRSMYRQSRVFLFPRPQRFEPLGLMPIEAAAAGCRVAVPDNSGCADILPPAYAHPTEHVPDLVESMGSSVFVPPPSPTDPADRVRALA